MSYLMEWLIAIYAPANAPCFLLDWTEASIAGAKLNPAAVSLELSTLGRIKDVAKDAWKKLSALHARSPNPSGVHSSTEQLISLVRRFFTARESSPTLQDHARLWRLLRWMEMHSDMVFQARVKAAELEKSGKELDWNERRKLHSVLELRPNARETLNAWAAGAATAHDFCAAALLRDDPNSFHHGFRDLEWIGSAKSREGVLWPEGADAAYDAVRSRVIQIELSRGDAPTAASKAALALRPSGGMDVVVPVLAHIGGAKLLRGGIWSDYSKAAVYSTLLRNAVPRSGETPDAFAAEVKKSHISDDRLIELALYAPQWSEHVERALGWPDLAEGVWWIHAHTKDDKWRIDSEIRDGWDARIAERTPVPKDELNDGAVDPAWFARAHDHLGDDRWKALYNAAKFASGAGGHKRAQLYADAMLARTTEAELVERIQTKRHQDAIRALGLCPIKSGKQGTAQVLTRYKLMQEFRRTSSKHGGSMLQASEKRAVEIGMQNLARTAGYADPIRLQWAMETESVADLAKGPISVTSAETTVSLSIDEDGSPSLSAIKKGKPLKSVPADVKKNEKVKELSDRLSDLRRQAGHMRLSLEQAMCRGDEFSGDELSALFRHPILRPMLTRLVFVSQNLLGYPEANGKSLRTLDGSAHPLPADAAVRIAHPTDLLASKKWHDWQRDCIAAERIQPFKQVFRELYLPTAAERGEIYETTRYRSHQVQPRQALALFGSRGWVARPEEGVHRTFHHERITAFVTFEEYFHTPAEIECLTLRGLSFIKVGEHEPLRIDQLPPRLFSEVLRDMDLVVSVAHAGAVDPEASQSCVEMRAALLRETARVLKLDNVSVNANRATITGHHAQYSLHLGSASVQMLPGGSVFIIAVQSQHRGRIFLPFADEDPKTAEVLAKALLLARDKEIQDPAILEQIRR